MSERGLAGVPRKSSGAMKLGVPAKGAQPNARSSTRLTRPKSASLALPSGVMSTLAGLISRWTSPELWAAPKASTICRARSAAHRLERALPHE